MEYDQIVVMMSSHLFFFSSFMLCIKHYIAFKRQYNFVHINKGRSNVYTRNFGNISPRIWNALQTKIDVNVFIVKFKSTSKLYFMKHNLIIIYTK